jgi:hypothetical protein
MVDTASPYRSNYNNYIPPDDPRNSAGNFQQDYKEKRKLLIRWGHYFPHEHVKEFDVRAIISRLNIT